MSSFHQHLPWSHFHTAYFDTKTRHFYFCQYLLSFALRSAIPMSMSFFFLAVNGIPVMSSICALLAVYLDVEKEPQSAALLLKDYESVACILSIWKTEHLKVIPFLSLPTLWFGPCMTVITPCSVIKWWFVWISEGSSPTDFMILLLFIGQHIRYRCLNWPIHVSCS